MIDIKTAKEKAIEELTHIDGEKLQASANLTSPGQFPLILEGLIYEMLGSEYVPRKTENYLRLSLSYNARWREDMVRIGTSGQATNEKSPGFLRPYGEDQ